MPSYQTRTGEKASPYTVSMYPSTVAILREVQELTGESQGAIIRRLAERELARLERAGVLTCEVLTFPSYVVLSDPIDTVVVFRQGGAEDQVVRAKGCRLKPMPPQGSFVLIPRPKALEGDLCGQLVDVEIAEGDGSPVMTMKVEALTKREVDETQAYCDCINAVFRGIGEKLHLRVPPTGSDRWIGPYRVAHTGPVGVEGNVGWSVLLPGRLGRRFNPVPWRSTGPDETASKLAAAILDLSTR